MPKFWSRKSEVGELGMKIAGRLVDEMGFKWMAQPSATDTGIDAIIEVVDPLTRAASNRLVSVQVKTTSDCLLDASKQISYACTDEDLEYWYVGTTPTLLVIVSVADDMAWFASVRDYFTGVPESGRTLHMDAVVDRLGPGARRTIESVAYSGRPWHWWEASDPDAVPLSYLQEFRRALGTALRDREAEEKSGPCPLFVDTDVAVEGLFPLEAVVTRSLHELSDDRVFSRSLWRFGLLGRPSLLGGHQEELQELVGRRVADPVRRSANLEDRPQVFRLLLKLKAAASAGRVQEFAESLAMADRGTAMLAAAMIHGNQGLRKTLDLLQVQPDGFSPASALHEPRTEFFLQAIRRADPLRRSFTLNNVQDAVALTHLSLRVEADRRGGRRQAGYFSSGTRVFGDLLRCDRTFASQFVVDGWGGGDAMDHPSSVWRSTSYLLCRAIFDALRPEGALSHMPTTPESVISLNDLEELSRVLASVIDAMRSPGDANLSMRALERAGVRGSTLLATIAFVQSITFAKRMWLQDTAAAIGRLAAVVGTTEVSEFARLRFAELAGAFDYLERSQLAAFHERAQAFIARLESRRSGSTDPVI